MKTISLTRGLSAIVDDEDYDYLSQFKWHALKSRDLYYAMRTPRIPGNHKKRHYILMHRLVCNTPAGLHTDHINGNTLDNRRSNLRTATRAQNQHNRRLNGQRKAPHAPAYKGVTREAAGVNRWVARITVNGTRYHLGTYSTPEEAAEVYRRAAIEKCGAYARVS